jgi:ketosteroid isomerase-like protein
MLSALCAFAVRAGDAETIAAIDKAAAALNAAFEKDDVGAIKALTTPDHIAVTPYYDGPQSLDDQAASLPDLEHRHTTVGDVSVTLLGPDTALRSYTAELKGSFKGNPHPRRAFISAIWVKQNGAWVEKFYQVTALRSGAQALKDGRQFDITAERIETP